MTVNLLAFDREFFFLGNIYIYIYILTLDISSFNPKEKKKKKKSAMVLLLKSSNVKKTHLIPFPDSFFGASRLSSSLSFFFSLYLNPTENRNQKKCQTSAAQAWSAKTLGGSRRRRRHWSSRPRRRSR